MNSLLSSSIMFHYQIDDIPHLSTTFNPKEDNIFSKAKQDIHLCVHFTSLQKKHFCQYLDLLSDDLPLEKYHSIHILDSNTQTEDYYVQINNLAWNRTDNLQNHKIYINYKPNLFVESTGTWVKKYFLGFGSLLFKKINNDSKINLKIGNEPSQIKSNFILKTCKCLTLINCFSYATLYYLQKNSDADDNIQTLSVQKIINKPFRSISSMIFDGSIYSIGGSMLSNFYPYYSSILFNGFMLFVNYKMLKSMKMF